MLCPQIKVRFAGTVSVLFIVLSYIRNAVRDTLQILGKLSLNEYYGWKISDVYYINLVLLCLLIYQRYIQIIGAAGGCTF